MARLIDTSVFVEIERTGRPIEALVAGALAEPHALASITASELLFGVERANTLERRRRRSMFVDAVLAEIPVLLLDVAVARAHARLWAVLEATGARYDMIVAATALANGYEVLTLNIREFARVPGLTVQRPEWRVSILKLTVTRSVGEEEHATTRYVTPSIHGERRLVA